MTNLWNEAQQDIRNRYLAIGREMVRPSVAHRDRELVFDRQLWRRLGQSGLFGVHMPKAYGGQGLGIWEFAAALDGFAEGCQDMGVLVSFVAQVGLVQSALLNYGSEGQCRQWLPAMIAGERIGCFAITEPTCGSDVRGLKLQASATASGYRINGQKWNITNAPVADLCLTFARVEGIGAKDITCFVIDTSVPGLEQSKPFELLGNRGTPIGSLTFSDVAVGSDQVVGGLGEGLNVLYFAFLIERVLTGLIVTGCMAPIIRECVRYSRQRETFGRPIGDNQYVQGHIVEAYTQLELLRGVLFRALSALERGDDCSRLASIVKLVATEALHDACLKAMKIHGNYGYRQDQYYERLLRDSIGLFFAGGTAEIHKHVIWKELVSEVEGTIQSRKELRLDTYQSVPRVSEEGATV